jgi:hypothetical protein
VIPKWSKRSKIVPLAAGTENVELSVRITPLDVPVSR